MSNRAARRRTARAAAGREAQRRAARRAALDQGKAIAMPPVDAEHPAWHFWLEANRSGHGGTWRLHDTRVIEHIRQLSAAEKPARSALDEEPATAAPAGCTCQFEPTGQRHHDYACPAHNTDPTQPPTESTNP